MSLQPFIEDFANEGREPDEQGVYAEVGGKELAYMLYRPTRGEGLRPAIVCVHGGGWSGGGMHQFKWHAERFSRQGYVAVSVGYRLVADALWPAQLHDVQRAVRWLRSRAGELSIDPARVGALGSSAGGHLVACLGVRDTAVDEPAELTGLSSRVQAVVDVHGIHNLPACADHRIAGSIARLVGGTIEEARYAWLDASPDLFVDGQAAPTFVTHDPDDPTVPYADSVRFAHTLMAQGRPVTFVPTPGAGHGYVYTPMNEWTHIVWPQACRFLADALKLD